MADAIDVLSWSAGGISGQEDHYIPYRNHRRSRCDARCGQERRDGGPEM